MGGGWRGLAADLARAAAPRGREQLGCFVIEGTRLHERALRAGMPPRAVLVGEGFAEEAEREAQLVAALARAGCRIETAPRAELERLTEGRSIGALQGLVPIPEERPLEGALLLVAVEVEDPGNVGALARTALASGAAGLVAVGISDPYHPRAVRTSMGSLFKLPVKRYASLDPLFDALDKLGLAKLAAVSEGGVSLPAVELGDRGVAVFVGSEAFGLDARVAAACERRVTVPMASGVDSFSVNAAAAVILYEIARRSLAARVE